MFVEAPWANLKWGYFKRVGSTSWMLPRPPRQKLGISAPSSNRLLLQKSLCNAVDTYYQCLLVRIVITACFSLTSTTVISTIAALYYDGVMAYFCCAKYLLLVISVILAAPHRHSAQRSRFLQTSRYYWTLNYTAIGLLRTRGCGQMPP
ncbi:hypothetical protein ARMSODRAFT_384560 [Armillaria solidipes]|uniref:Uncharacterized protein n=1 Tax=Armillaria solidipes TaxID=1076256 RepID=A0A2H3C7S7_9AGAR|nr:hypothetical protein ARMSODRAFT_384560 [Armillaria solidipes]